MVQVASVDFSLNKSCFSSTSSFFSFTASESGNEIAGGKFAFSDRLLSAHSVIT